MSAHWDGSAETEEKIKEETKATIRCIPMDAEEKEGVCVYSGKPSSRRVLLLKLINQHSIFLGILNHLKAYVRLVSHYTLSLSRTNSHLP